MKKMHKILRTLTGAVLIFSMTVIAAGCSGGESQNGGSSSEESEYEFNFSGTETFDDGQEYTLQIAAEKAERQEDNRFSLTVNELPMFELGGTYVYEENKGYKLYFEDVGEQFSYTSYDPESGDFSLRYKSDLGEALGARTIMFTYHDPDFADVYDGEGLGPTPPTFEGSGWGGFLGQFEINPAQLRCYEDGTATFTATAVTAVDPMTGTWDYDEASDTYHFNFPPQTFANSDQVEEQPDGTIGYKTVYGESDVRFDKYSETTETDYYATYNEETGTYEFDLQIVWYVYSMIHMSYTK